MTEIAAYWKQGITRGSDSMYWDITELLRQVKFMLLIVYPYRVPPPSENNGTQFIPMHSLIGQPSCSKV